MSKTQYGTFEELINITTPELQSIVRALKDLILKHAPDTTEVVRLGDRAATYGVGPKKMSEGYVYILPYKSHVNLGFYKGAHLYDPARLLERTGKQLRHIKIKNMDKLTDPALAQLIIDAIKERKAALKIV